MAKNDPKRPKNDPKWPKGKHASSSIMECEEFILPDWSPPDDPARVLAAKGRLKPIHKYFRKRNGHLPDWSSPDDPARFLAAVGRLKPS